ncbi:MAG TPA: Zn-dependent hydrolase [Steroidobacteraceae bacterium]|nr:Zn-dependent hydrolase [Steroidobacteraceae bacterium]
MSATVDSPPPFADLRVDAQRLWRSLEQFAQIGATTRGGCNRQALTDEDRAGRDQFTAWAREAGCTHTVDAIGNLYVRRSGQDHAAAPVMASSHLDTQATGGRFDGVYGVLAGLELIRVLNEHRIKTRRAIEVVSWTNEEGCRFVPAMLGSGTVAGTHELAFALDRRDAEGRSVGEELDRIGYRGQRPARPFPVHAAFEAHIEQGPILERDGVTIGVVTGIQGLHWLDVVLTGVPCHAGPTPMEMRRDPWRAATPIIDGAMALAEARRPWGRCTVGDAQCKPGARNTVPETLRIAIDIRHPDGAVLEHMYGDLHTLVAREAARANVEARIEPVWHMPATSFAPRLVDLVEATARRLGYTNERITSGAGHDSLNIARFAPTTMIFVPCAGGLSHNEAELADPQDLAAGANVLLHAVLAAANE